MSSAVERLWNGGSPARRSSHRACSFPARSERLSLHALAVFVALLCCAAPCGATTASVATPTDLASAVSNGAVDTIVLTAGITVSSQLLVNRNLTVRGDPAQCATANSGPAPTAGLCTLSGGGASRIFKVYNAGAAVTLTLSSLALVFGSDVADSLGGAAVLLLPGTSTAASPALVATGCVFQGNSATGTGPGGAVSANPSTLPAASMAMTLTNTAFLQNSALSAAGAVLAAGPTVLANVSFVGNSATYAAAQLTNVTTQVSGSLGLGFAGALQLASCAGVTGSSLSITGGSFAGNWGTQGGAVVCGPDCTCTLGGGVSFANNSAVGASLVGGACTAGSGGAVVSLPGSTLQITGASFSNNTASCDGGAVFLSGNKQGSIANTLGGIYGFVRASPVLTFTAGTSAALTALPVTGRFSSVTLAGNTALLNGGGLYLEGVDGAMNVSGCTFTGGASLTKKGGAIYAGSSSVVNVSGTSIVGASAGLAGGAIAIGASSNVSMTSSLISGCSCATGTGGGVFLDTNITAVASSLVLQGNSAAEGGGLFLSASAVLSASGLSFTSNSVASSGGGLYAAAYASLMLTGSAFTSNSAANAGGALLASGSTLVSVSTTAFASNAAVGLAPHGGAASLENVASITLATCTFTSDRVTTSTTFTAPVGAIVQLVYAGAGSAGALFLGAAPSAAGGVPVSATITDTTFTNCSATGNGGALAALGQTSVITLALSGVTAFTGNSAAGSGGALALSGSVAASLSGVVLRNNTAVVDGGAAVLFDGVTTTITGAAAAFTANSAGGRGGALLLQGTAGASTTITAGAFSRNSAMYGGAVGISGAAHTLAMSGALLSANNASFGAAFTLAAVTPAVNSQLTLSGVTIRSNTAQVGALYYTDALVDVPVCAGCTLSLNTASNYGSAIASPPYNFSVASGASVVSGTVCALTLTMHDLYGSAVTSWPGFAATLQPGSTLSGDLDANSFASGSSLIDSARITGVPQSTVTLSVTVTEPALASGIASASLGVLVAACGPNQVFEEATSLCQCERGYAMAVGSTAGCQPCAAGSYAAGIGEVACAACAATDVSGPASSGCVTCPPNSRPVTDDLCMCESYYFGRFTSLNNGTCAACPANAVCQYGIIVAEPGYWKSSAASTDVQPCPEEEACDFENRTQLLVQLTLNGTDEATLLQASCYAGYEGPLCAVCSAGYGRDTDLRCGLCPSFAYNTGKLALTSFTNLLSVSMTIRSNMLCGLRGGVRPPLHSQIIKIFLNYLTVTSLASRAPLRWPKRIEELFAAQSTGTHSSGKTVSLECSLPDRGHPKFFDVMAGYLILMPVAAALPYLFWNVIYVVGMRPGAVKVAYGDRFARWWDETHRGGLLTSFAELPELVLMSPRESQVAAMMKPFDDDSDSSSGGASQIRFELSGAADDAPRGAPTLSKADVGYEAHLNALVAKPVLAHDVESARANMRHFTVISFICILFFLWTPVTSVLLNVFVCIEVDPATPASPFHGFFMMQHMRESCLGGRHLRYMIGGIIGVVFIMFGIPVGTGLFLWHKRSHMDDPDFRLRYGFVYYGYRRNAIYYESVVMLRKLALVIVTVFFSHSAPSAGAYVLAIMLGVMFASVALHLVLRPFTEPLLDRLELMSMSASVGTLWLGLFFFLGTPRVVEVILTVVIVVWNALLFVQFALCIVSEMLRAQLQQHLPDGAKNSEVSEDVMSEHVTYFWWAKAASMRRGTKRRLYERGVLQFIAWIERGRRSVRTIRAEIPGTLRRMQMGAMRHEYERRATNVAAWVGAGLVLDAEVAAWLCRYEGRQRDPASLLPLVRASCARARALPDYMAAAQRGGAAAYEAQHAVPDKREERSRSVPPPPPRPWWARCRAAAPEVRPPKPEDEAGPAELVRRGCACGKAAPAVKDDEPDHAPAGKEEKQQEEDEPGAQALRTLILLLAREPAAPGKQPPGDAALFDYGPAHS